MRTIDRFKYLYQMVRGAAKYLIFRQHLDRKMNIPEYMYLDMCNYCNSDCVFCSYRYDPRPKSIMPTAIFQKAVTQFKEMGGEKINLTPLWGELFSIPDILSRIDFLHQKGFKEIRTYTNASLLHKFNVRNILCSGLTVINISTGPLQEDVYMKIYQKGNYRQILRNMSDLIKEFRALKKSSSKELTVREITIEFRADRSLAECKKLSDFCHEIAPFLSPGVKINSLTEYDGWSGVIKKEELVPGMTFKENPKFTPLPCLRSSYLQVTSDGRIRLCGCRHDFATSSDELALGNIADGNLRDLYNSKKTQEIKETFLKDKLLTVCSKCAWYEL